MPFWIGRIIGKALQKSIHPSGMVFRIVVGVFFVIYSFSILIKTLVGGLMYYVDSGKWTTIRADMADNVRRGHLWHEMYNFIPLKTIYEYLLHHNHYTHWGSADIDDVILRTVGGALGYAVWISAVRSVTYINKQWLSKKKRLT